MAYTLEQLERRRAQSKAYYQANRIGWQKKYAANRKAYSRAYYLANKERQAIQRDEHRKSRPDLFAAATARNNQKRRLARHGLTQAELDHLRLTQKNVCALCHNPAKGRKDLHIDHDHDTGVVRGLLCSGCNIALGLFKENTLTLTRAVAYLIASAHFQGTRLK